MALRETRWVLQKVSADYEAEAEGDPCCCRGIKMIIIMLRTKKERALLLL